MRRLENIIYHLQNFLIILTTYVVLSQVINLPISIVMFISALSSIIFRLWMKDNHTFLLGTSLGYLGAIKYIYTLYNDYIYVTVFLIISGLIHVLFAYLLKHKKFKIIQNGLFPPVILGSTIIVFGFNLFLSDYNELLSSNIIQFEVSILFLAMFLALAFIPKIQYKRVNIITIFHLIVIGSLVFVASKYIRLEDLKHLFVLEIPRIPLWNEKLDFTLQLGVIINLTFIALPIALFNITKFVGECVLINDDHEEHENDLLIPELLKKLGVINILSGILGGMGMISYSESTASIKHDKQSNQQPILITSIVLLITSFFPNILAIISSIPSVIIGVVAVFLYGTIIISGIRVIQKHHVNLDHPKNLMILIAMIFIGLSPVNQVFMGVYFNNYMLALITGILLYNIIPGEESMEEPNDLHLLLENENMGMFMITDSLGKKKVKLAGTFKNIFELDLKNTIYFDSLLEYLDLESRNNLQIALDDLYSLKTRAIHLKITLKEEHGSTAFDLVGKITEYDINNEPLVITGFLQVIDNVDLLLNEYIKEVQYLDDLTKLRNRKSLYHDLSYTYYGYGLLINIDDFKSINDTYGIEYGDQVLIEFSKILKQILNERNIYHFYADEFFLLFQGNEVQLVELIRQIQYAQSEVKIDELNIPITVSIGVAKRENYSHYYEFLKNVDEAMHLAKREGKTHTYIKNS